MTNNMSFTEIQEDYFKLLTNLENSVYFKFHVGTGQTDYVTITVATRNSSGRCIAYDVTYFVAKNFGFSLGRRNTKREFQIPRGGGGYSKTHDVAYDLQWKLFGAMPNNLPENWAY